MTITQYFRFFQDLWRYFKAHSNPVSADSWWIRFLDDGEALAARYEYTPFVIRMTAMVQREVDNIFTRKVRNKT